MRQLNMLQIATFVAIKHFYELNYFLSFYCSLQHLSPLIKKEFAKLLPYFTNNGTVGRFSKHLFELST